MDLTWFRQPSAEQPGTLNLCYNALDRQVIRGRAGDPALVTPLGVCDFATVLEEVAALAGTLRALGVDRGHPVRIRLADPADALVAELACLRIGAVAGDVSDPVALLTSGEADEPSARVRVLRGPASVDPERDVDWALAVKAGREDPAGCADLAGDAAAYVLDDGALSLVDLAALLDRPDGHLPRWAPLCAGEPVRLP